MKRLKQYKKTLIIFIIVFAAIFAFPVIAASPTSGCAVFGAKTTSYIKLALNVIRIGGPLLVVALTITDFLHVLISGEEKTYKEVGIKFIKRLVALAALLLLPYILFFILKISGVLKLYGIADQDVFCVLGF